VDVSDKIVNIIADVMVVVAVLAVLGWYFMIYDTAQGKCQRGDPGACVIWQASR
jgi:hypothetical protein